MPRLYPITDNPDRKPFQESMLEQRQDVNQHAASEQGCHQRHPTDP